MSKNGFVKATFAPKTIKAETYFDFIIQSKVLIECHHTRKLKFIKKDFRGLGKHNSKGKTAKIWTISSVVLA